MKQQSDILHRAEKEYKNSREKFMLLLREIISNSIHALIIRKDKQKGFKPDMSLDITYDEGNSVCEMVLKDNGEGFTPVNTECFNELDRKNTEKEQHKLHPLGQGRLALVYFTDEARYETVYKNVDGMLERREFPYPPQELPGLFDIMAFESQSTTQTDTYTKLTIRIDKQQSFGRAKTFFGKYSDVDKFKNWAIETFFPFFVTDEDLLLRINYNGGKATICKKDIEADEDSVPFTVELRGSTYAFQIWLLSRERKLSGDNEITCFARNLKAELDGGRLSYAIDSEQGYNLCLTSDFFDENVDSKGERIEISPEEITSINKELSRVLDEYFVETIKSNKRATKRHLEEFRKHYPSLDVFVQSDMIEGRKDVVSEADLVKNALDEKGRIEKKFWIESDKEIKKGDIPFAETEEGRKLLNSSLQVYVKHREIVLKRLEKLIHYYDDEGNIKPEAESEIHNLLLRRGKVLENSTYINHLHNLWILDDKFTVFSSDFHALSSKQGQSKSDIYIWSDDPKKTKEILILELKSTTNAHNAGSSDENMIAQVKRYAKSFYKDPRKHLNWDVETKGVLYTGIILASRSDIDKEFSSDLLPGQPHKIPFLQSSYFFEESFRPVDGLRDFSIPIRIELYSYEDIHELASQRNEVFFKLLNNEYQVESDETESTEGDL